MKVGSLPYVLRLDWSDKAVRSATPTEVDVEVHCPPPTLAIRNTVPEATRQRHRFFSPVSPNWRGIRIGRGHPLPPVMNLGRSPPPQPGNRSKPTVRPVARRLFPLSSGDVSLTDFISSMRELEGFGRTRITSGDVSDDKWRGSTRLLRRNRYPGANHRHISISLYEIEALVEEAYCILHGFTRHLGAFPRLSIKQYLMHVK